ncbi:MAG: Flp pilus assembly complex ATPase component TadA [Blastocatellia bacterium]|nr:Flp pilus assembly complex ATPase component TadA [Blastocatellia bacterium]
MSLFDKFRRIPPPSRNMGTGSLNRIGPVKGSISEQKEIQTSTEELLEVPSNTDIFEELFLDRTKLFDIDDEVLALVDPKFAKEQIILPIDKTGQVLTLLCASKQNQRVAEHVLKAQHRGLSFKFLYSTEEIIRSAIDCHYLRRDLSINEQQRTERYKQLSTHIQKVETGRKQRKHLIFSNSRQLSHQDTAIRELVENLLCDAHWARATDIDIDHFRLDPKGSGYNNQRELMVCRIRVDGEYQVIHEETMELEKYERIPHILKIYAGLDPNNIWDGQSGVVRPTLTYATRESPVEFRVNFIPSADERGESISIRIQEKDNFTFTLDKVGLLPFQEEIFRDELMMLTDGLVVFAGPINKGKNTTMVCLIKEFQAKFATKKIVTVEDPPEFNLPYVTQIAVDRKRADEKKESGEKRGFHYYLAHILRHNPDIIVVGEVREPEPAQMAIETAGIGHLVLTTMHTANTIESIDRMRNFGIEDYKIGGALKVVVAQRLVKKICTECETVTDEEIPSIPRLSEYIAHTGWLGSAKFVKGSGRNRQGEICPVCQGTGFHGRLGIFEVLVINRKIRALINQGATPDDIRHQALKEGFRSLWSTGLERALRGETTLGQILYHIGKPDPFLEGLPDREYISEAEIPTARL